jgi:hypothetical protein
MLAAWTQKAVSQLAEAFPVGDHENKSVWTAYLPHARYVLASSPQHDGATERFMLLEKVGYCLFTDGKYTKVGEIYEEVLGWKERIFGPVHAETLQSVGDLAKILVKLGKYGEAERISRMVLSEKTKMLRMEHPHTLISMANFTSTYQSQGQCPLEFCLGASSSS